MVSVFSFPAEQIISFNDIGDIAHMKNSRHIVHIFYLINVQILIIKTFPETSKHFAFKYKRL